ncbi:site-specific DNA-methyltransferase [Dermacoccus nishinomiyaensis]|uniref:site-specific DNA-methyltransferase n=1 Tax=Dermacoccus TaxID=57495 RepID=UPI00093AD9DF|nr:MULTISPECIES: site-specific DNA-methyltransferase [Dermacoccus]TJZ95084.1 site-specific DNA-methyltransferase [Dermacoccus nishinomiyaensis]
MTKQRLELTWFNKDQALIPTEHGRYGYRWVDPSDPRYCETRPLVFDDVVRGEQTPKWGAFVYSERADLPPTNDNLLIHGESGDVLEALTRVPDLAEKYVGKIKLIYIDPPFNTAQTFTHYEDNLEHSIWLTMMRDRLLHMRRLLCEDGSIWVHLDYAENHRMRLLLDEVFGPENFEAEVIWQKAGSPRNDAAGFSFSQDTIAVYRRGPQWRPNRMARLAASNTSRYRSRDGDPVPWRDGDATAPGAATHQGMVYGIQHPVSGNIIYPTPGRHWGLSQSQMLANMNEYATYELRDIDDADARARVCGISSDAIRSGVQAIMLAVPLDSAAHSARQRYDAGHWPEIVMLGLRDKLQRKKHLADDGRVPETLWLGADVGGSLRGKNQVKDLFPGLSPFATPKPEELLERVIHIGSNPGDIVLDIFAGSGTTAAVAQKMGRRWVTCELIGDTIERFTRPRLEKVVSDEDPGGITRTAGERVAADGVELPEGLSAADAQKFTAALNKLVADSPALAKSVQVKQLKAMAKTVKTKETVNWRGGGGFRVAHLAPACFDYDEDLHRVVLTDAATGNTLVESIAANLGFTLEMDDLYFDGYRGRTMLKVHEGILDLETADDLLSHLEEGEKLVIAATGVMDGVREHVRKRGKGSKVVHVPDDIFRYSEEDA